MLLLLLLLLLVVDGDADAKDNRNAAFRIGCCWIHWSISGLKYKRNIVTSFRLNPAVTRKESNPNGIGFRSIRRRGGAR